MITLVLICLLLLKDLLPQLILLCLHSVPRSAPLPLALWQEDGDQRSKDGPSVLLGAQGQLLTVAARTTTNTHAAVRGVNARAHVTRRVGVSVQPRNVAVEIGRVICTVTCILTKSSF